MILSPEFLQTLDSISMVVQRTRHRQAAGQKQSLHLGSGLEFHDYVPYQPGDDYRYVDWSMYARLGQLFLKTFIEEHDTQIHLLVDSSESMGFYPEKLRRAAELAGALGYISLRQLDAVGAAFTSTALDFVLPPRKGRRQIFQLLQFLDQTPSGDGTDWERVLRLFTFQYRRPGVAVLFSDFFDESNYTTLLHHMLGIGWQVHLVHILTPDEWNPQWTESLMLQDVETNEKVAMDPSVTAVGYSSVLTDLQQPLQQLTSRGGHYVPVSTDLPLDKAIFEALRLQGVVR